MDAEFDELARKGKKSAAEVENMKQLANEVQYAILTRKLGPGALHLLLWIRSIVAFHSSPHSQRLSCSSYAYLL